MPTQYEISINPTSAKGDILSHDGSSRIRVATGTSGQILTASSSAGLLWKTFSATADSDVALIADVTTTSSLSIYTISSIPSTYQDLKLLLISDSSADTGSIRVSLESTQGTNHNSVEVRQANAGTVLVLRGNGPTMDSGARFILYGIKRSS